MRSHEMIWARIFWGEWFTRSHTPSATIAMLVMCLEANWPLFALGLRLISVGKHKCLRSSIYPIYRYCMFLPVHPVDIRVHGDFTKSPNHGDKLSKNSVKINLKWYDRPTYQSKSCMLVNITIYFNRLTYITCWWFGSFFMFPYIGNNNPIWLIFFRGVETTNQIISHYTFNISQWNGWFNPLWKILVKCKIKIQKSLGIYDTWISNDN